MYVRYHILENNWLTKQQPGCQGNWEPRESGGRTEEPQGVTSQRPVRLPPHIDFPLPSSPAPSHLFGDLTSVYKLIRHRDSEQNQNPQEIVVQNLKLLNLHWEPTNIPDPGNTLCILFLAEPRGNQIIKRCLVKCGFKENIIISID